MDPESKLWSLEGGSLGCYSGCLLLKDWHLSPVERGWGDCSIKLVWAMLSILGTQGYLPWSVCPRKETHSCKVYRAAMDCPVILSSLWHQLQNRLAMTARQGRIETSEAVEEERIVNTMWMSSDLLTYLEFIKDRALPSTTSLLGSSQRSGWGWELNIGFSGGGQ